MIKQIFAYAFVFGKAGSVGYYLILKSSVGGGSIFWVFIKP